MTYTEKLKDPRWQRKRLETLTAADWTCHHCSSKEKTLHVHHVNYERGRDPWEYTDTELVVLCVRCHSLIENRIKLLRSHLARLTPQDSANLLMLASVLNGGDPLPPAAEGVARNFCEALRFVEQANTTVHEGSGNGRRQARFARARLQASRSVFMTLLPQR